MECNWGDGGDGGAGSDGVTRVYKEEEEGGVSIAGQTKKKEKKSHSANGRIIKIERKKMVAGRLR